MENCKDCNKEITGHYLKKYCFDCIKKRKSECDKKYRIKNYDKIREQKYEAARRGKKIKCVLCKKEYERAAWNRSKFCSRECFHKESKVSRKLSGNPAWKNGGSSQAYNQMYFDKMYKEKGLLPHEIGCEVCTIKAGVIFDRHHIVFKSEMGRHKEINNPLNIIQVCRGCHLRFHAKKSRRNDIVRERKLEELFNCRLIC